MLYGDLDWKRFLAFLDKEYLCDAKKSYGKEDGWSFQSGSGRQEKQEMQNIGMSAFYSPEPDGLENGGESFFRQATVPSPAYRGDASENAAVVSYAMDLSGHFMGKADPVQHHCGNDECGWIGFQGKAADGGHPLVMRAHR